MKRLEGKTALITGASRGIGAAVALALAEEGAHLILLARTVGALEEMDDAVRARGAEATLVPLDITDYNGIDRLGGIIAEKYGKLDILIGNAAVLGPISPLGHITPKDWDELIGVNLTANWRLIRSFDPLLRAADHGRAIFVTSSSLVENPRPFWGGYAVTKAGLECLVRTYATEVEKTPLKVNLLNPGALRTAMRARAMPGEDPMTLDTPQDVAPLFVKMCLPEFDKSGEIIDYKDYKAGAYDFL